MLVQYRLADYFMIFPNSTESVLLPFLCSFHCVQFPEILL
ncbi:hypothetical protein NSE_0831 [Neorickettsia sennetsu str. Miyayama]|uniref:Uncharacterized protein n=1 Tax=Ehrlichia sennetsu (strain ATCC VR-367 / Miyayama) TaxID=222891 RepID=Q2GCU5_EHRS3|nr:hypothetical protein NSE_0831 [Neorickettsia sennetsu str. Miyayama]